MLLGDTGVGKSSVALTLLGKPENDTNVLPDKKCFKVAPDEHIHLYTKDACVKVGLLFGKEQNITVVDTPGWGGDKDNQYLITEKIVDFLQEDIQYVNTFALLLPASNKKLKREFVNTLRLIKTIFEGRNGKHFVSHVVLVATHWSHFPQTVNEDEKKTFLETHKEMFRNESLFGWENLKAVYFQSLNKLDNHDEEVRDELRKLVSLSQENDPFHCKDIVKVEDEISKMQKSLKEHQKNLTEIRVSFEAQRNKNSEMQDEITKLKKDNKKLTDSKIKWDLHDKREGELENCNTTLTTYIDKLEGRVEASTMSMVGIGLGSTVLGVLLGFFIFRSCNQMAVNYEDEEKEAEGSEITINLEEEEETEINHEENNSDVEKIIS